MIQDEDKKLHLMSTLSSSQFSVTDVFLDIGANDMTATFENSSEAREKKVKAECQICKKTFARASVEKLHDKTYHGEEVTIYSCGFCELTSMNVRNILAHHGRKHKAIPMPAETEIHSETIKNTEKCQRGKTLQHLCFTDFIFASSTS